MRKEGREAEKERGVGRVKEHGEKEIETVREKEEKRNHRFLRITW